MNRDIKKVDDRKRGNHQDHAILDANADDGSMSSKIDTSIHPDPWAVICGRGLGVFNHQGNKYLRGLVLQSRGEFGNATNRRERATVITNIIDAVRAKGVGFVKKRDDGHWVEISDRLAREKVGQMMRESQGSKYRSSNKAKRNRQLQQQEEINRNTQKVLLSNATVAAFIAQLSGELSTKPPWITDDDHVLEVMTQANCQILAALKQDKSLLERFNSACNIKAAPTASSSTGSDMDTSEDESPTDEFDRFMKMTLE